MVSKNMLLQQLPPFTNTQILIEEFQEVPDIIEEVVNAHEYFSEDYDLIFMFFDTGDLLDFCENLFDFCKSNIFYKVEKEDRQTTKSPAAILTTGQGDCKHYAAFIAGNLAALERYTGKKINWWYRFASYNYFDDTPAHVFVVVKINGKDYWIDPVLKTFNSREVTPVSFVDKKIKLKNMSLSRISGMGAEPQLEDSVRQLVYYGIITPAKKIDNNRYAQTLNSLNQMDANDLKNAYNNVLTSAKNGIGDVWSTITQILAKVFAPDDSSNNNAALQQQLLLQQEIAAQNAQKNSFTQYIPILLIAGVGIYLIMRK